VVFRISNPAPQADTVAIVPLDLSGVAVYDATSLDAGTRRVTASYSFGAPWLASTAALNQTVNAITVTNTLSTSKNPSNWSESITFAAAIAPTTATGQVVFNIDGVDVGTATVTNGNAAYTTAALSVGSHAVIAKYTGDANHLAVNASLTQTVTVWATTVALGSSNAGGAITYGTPVDYTATVGTVLAGGGTPTGSVVFDISNSFLGASSFTLPVTNGVATLAGHLLDGGDNTITATYVPDVGKWGGSTSASLSQTVDRAFTTLDVLRSASTTRMGEPVTFMALVGPPGTGGTVRFYINGTTAANLAIEVPVAANGAAFWTTNGLPLGTTTVNVIFSGTVNYLHTGWVSLTQTVSPGSASVAVTSSQNPIGRALPVTFTATVSPVAPATRTPFGDVRFNIDGNWVGSWMPIDANGQYSITTSTLRGGRTHTVRAYFRQAGGWYNSATSPRYFQVVN
jgi:hypothetical protein